MPTFEPENPDFDVRHVIKPGRTLTVCAGEAVSLGDGADLAVATMLATIMALRDRGDLQD